ncbi:hypothetical protein M413DRAFT_382351 [Hebeloma cylindrosporum]|uniref:Uncharacterized protein n=1 Tax=Hebeloma cylindrosporum TaxID=76867 RepID=A0A0C3CH64_HEBCY|nr:hypothetical protein M413DRAFT_382351 [Hebeloma cylindrosporum h7]
MQDVNLVYSLSWFADINGLSLPCTCEFGVLSLLVCSHQCPLSALQWLEKSTSGTEEITDNQSEVSDDAMDLDSDFGEGTLPNIGTYFQSEEAMDVDP